ncbi:hypothetical protein GCM10009680_55890 [Streptomyces yatensis]|uniref:Copper resistance protein D domain-containing protein n=2 Tax=Streptomyces yatensis TaxID=155177 RepID=A0ABN2IMB7_9ACTN
MVPLTLVSSLRRSGGAPSPVPVTAAWASVFSVTNTVLALVGHHVVFDASPSWTARAAVAALLFVLAFFGAGRASVPARQVRLALVAQAVAGCWFAIGSADAHGRLTEAGLLVAAHVVMTVLLALMLHTVCSGRLAAVRTAASELRSLCAWLWRLLFPGLGVDATVPAVPTMPVFSGSARASPAGPLLADCVIRRGPPPGVPLATA